MIELTATANATGPAADGRLRSALPAALLDAQEAVAKLGVNEVRNRLHSAIKHGTGNLERHVRTERAVDSIVVTDGRVVYGPWLEGVISRNSTTRFKGYHVFRRVAGQLQNGGAGAIADRAVNDRLRGLL